MVSYSIEGKCSRPLAVGFGLDPRQLLLVHGTAKRFTVALIRTDHEENTYPLRYGQLYDPKKDDESCSIGISNLTTNIVFNRNNEFN